jgi:hypothetical protein
MKTETEVRGWLKAWREATEGAPPEPGSADAMLATGYMMCAATILGDEQLRAAIVAETRGLREVVHG